MQKRAELVRKMRSLVMSDPDVHHICPLCRGPVYIDEPGNRCPDCLLAIRFIEDVHTGRVGEVKCLAVGIPWQEHRAERDLIPKLPPSVLYGLLTECDARELLRRRVMMGVRRLTETVGV